MKKHFKTIVSILISAVCVLSSSITCNAEERTSLYVYEAELGILNTELGTKYAFPTDVMTSDELTEMENFYGKMSIDEFRSYIYSIHQLDINSAEGIYEESDIISIDPTEYVNSL